MFIEHIKSNVQTAKFHKPYLPETQRSESAGFIMAGKLLTGKNIVDLGQNRHFFPAIVIPIKL